VVSRLVLRPSTAEAPTCPRCGGAALTRLLSRFSTVKSEEQRLESLAGSSALGDVDENDPASMARFMKSMGQELGEDVGDDFDEAVDEAMTDDAADAEATSGNDDL
jgi:hypothetical protein